jgi:hypothetical protein
MRRYRLFPLVPPIHHPMLHSQACRHSEKGKAPGWNHAVMTRGSDSQESVRLAGLHPVFDAGADFLATIHAPIQTIIDAAQRLLRTTALEATIDTVIHSPLGLRRGFLRLRDRAGEEKGQHKTGAELQACFGFHEQQSPTMVG